MTVTQKIAEELEEIQDDIEEDKTLPEFIKTQQVRDLANDQVVISLEAENVNNEINHLTRFCNGPPVSETIYVGEACNSLSLLNSNKS